MYTISLHFFFKFLAELWEVQYVFLLFNTYFSTGVFEQDYISDPDEELRRAQLLDSVLLFALVNCQPSRRNATVQLLSSPNFCQVETCSVLLASQGNPYTEALLWLYRSHNLHSRVLDALKEEKSVAPGRI